ncbi:MAG TPA: hypothetical protein VI935_02225 [Thermodesulfobacteriota bacterium]|nr:hypothetical protein [Thermodesulfobacteriota bacterium]
MVRIELSSDEVEMLHEVLSIYLSDLRMEIADTDSMNYRETLKKTEVFLKDLLKRLEEKEA